MMMLRSIALGLLLAILSLAADYNVSGTWQFEVQTQMGSGTPTFVLKQEGSKVAGTYSGQLGEAKVTGKVEGNRIELEYSIAPAGESILVKYTGTIESATSMKGKSAYGDLGEGTWTAKKQ